MTVKEGMKAAGISEYKIQQKSNEALSKSVPKGHRIVGLAKDLPEHRRDSSLVLVFSHSLGVYVDFWAKMKTKSTDPLAFIVVVKVPNTDSYLLEE